MLKEKWKLTGFIILLFGAVGVGLWYLYPRTNMQAARTYQDLEGIESMYNADEEIAAAFRKKVAGDTEMAELYRAHRSRRNQIVLTFDGMPNQATALKLIDLLNKYKFKAVFFVEGANAAADAPTLLEISRAGFDIGGYTWVGLSHMEKLSSDKRIVDFCRTKKALQTLLNSAPTVLKCSRTQYTEDLMRDAMISGFDSVVKTSAYFPRRQLTDAAQATAYVRSLPRGSIVSVPIGAAVDVISYEPGKTDDRPAVDKQPGLREAVGKSDAPPPLPLLEEMELFFAALQQEKMTTTGLAEYPREKFVPTAAAAAAPASS